MTRSTCFPCAAKYSAMVVAASAARIRESGGWSEVETTTTGTRAMPSSPIAPSRKSRTSRPRSPTSASTVRSAEVPRVIIPTSVLFPTPLPPKIPMRCPRPQVSIPSIARMPQPSGSCIAVRPERQRGFSAQRPVLASAVRALGIQRLSRPVPSITRTSSPGPTRKQGRVPRVTRLVSVANARRAFERHREHEFSRENRRFLRRAVCGHPDVRIAQPSPTRAEGAFRLHQIVDDSFVTRPTQRNVEEIIQAGGNRERGNSTCSFTYPGTLAEQIQEIPARFP